MSILASLTPPKGLRVLITAGAGGIGKCIADGFVETGARVHISDINAAALDAAIGGAITGTRANSADPKDTERLFSEALDHLGGLDVVIANAGIAGPLAAIWEDQL